MHSQCILERERNSKGLHKGNAIHYQRKGEAMGRPVHTSRITVTRVTGPIRKAFIEGFEAPVFYGVHGGIKRFYKIEPKEEHPATLDHIIGGVGG